MGNDNVVLGYLRFHLKQARNDLMGLEETMRNEDFSDMDEYLYRMIQAIDEIRERMVEEVPFSTGGAGGVTQKMGDVVRFHLDQAKQGLLGIYDNRKANKGETGPVSEMAKDVVGMIDKLDKWNMEK